MTPIAAISKLDDLALDAAVGLCNQLEGHPHSVACALNTFGLTTATGMQYITSGKLSGEDLTASALLLAGCAVLDRSYVALRAQRNAAQDYALYALIQSLNRTSSRLFAGGSAIFAGITPFADSSLYCATLACMCASVSAGRYCMRAHAER